MRAKKTICVTLEPALVEEIDRIADGGPRSHLVEVLLESALGLRAALDPRALATPKKEG